MKENRKKFELYVFLSTFSRNLIEVFIPVILYEFGFELKEVIFYFFISNVFSLLLSYPCVMIARKFSNKLLTIIGIAGFVGTQMMLMNIQFGTWYLVLIGFLYALYRRGYWISRRYYNLKVMEKEKIASTFSVISIVNHLGVIVASYIGALMLDFVDVKTVTIISISIFVASLIPLALMKFKYEVSNEKLDVKSIVKEIPKRNLYLFGSYELLNVVKFLFALYLFIYVKDTYTTVGIYTLITNLSVLAFSYLYGKKIDNAKNFLKLSIVLTVVTYVCKANATGIILVIISFFEGIFTKMHEISISKEFYVLSKKFEYSSYNLLYEYIQNSVRSIALFILYIFNVDLKIMIYIVLSFMLAGAFMNFKYIEKEDHKGKIKEN